MKNELKVALAQIAPVWLQKDRTMQLLKETIENAEWLEAEAKRSLEHKRLPRLNGAGRAPTGRALCRSCREPIGKDTWRISLVFYDEEEGRFEPAGFIHPKCSKQYFGTNDVVARLQHFSPELGANGRKAAPSSPASIECRSL